MQSSRDSSVWRTLAVAFGDGLAFGVGVTLTRNAARLAATRSATSEYRPHNGALPAPGAPLNRYSADAVLSAIDGRFTEIGGHIDRRLAELEVKIKAELDLLDGQDRALREGLETGVEGLRGEVTEAIAAHRKAIEAEMRSLRAQMTAVHKEFAETLARLLDEQITSTVTARLQAVEERLRESIREETRVSGKDQQIAELRERLETQERNMLSLVRGLGQSCMQAAESISPGERRVPPPPPPPAASGTAGGAPAPEARVESAPDTELPGFARSRPRKPFLGIPVVSSFFFATGGLLLLHYL